jgi:3-oxoacyl-[acyl-carrier protein] reductase
MISETKIQEIGADYLIIESDISNEDAVRGIYAAVQERYERIRTMKQRRNAFISIRS